MVKISGTLRVDANVPKRGTPSFHSFSDLVLDNPSFFLSFYRGADKPLARLGRKQATATEEFELHIYYS